MAHLLHATTIITTQIQNKKKTQRGALLIHMALTLPLQTVTISLLATAICISGFYGVLGSTEVLVLVLTLFSFTQGRICRCRTVSREHISEYMYGAVVLER